MNTKVVSWLALMSLIGFFLWVVRGFIRGLRGGDDAAEEKPMATPEIAPEDGVVTVNWPAHFFLEHDDDLPIPATFVTLKPSGGFLRSSAPLVHGQKLVLYLKLPGEDSVKVATEVLMVSEQKGSRLGAQLRFEGIDPDLRKRLMRLAEQARPQPCPSAG